MPEDNDEKGVYDVSDATEEMVVHVFHEYWKINPGGIILLLFKILNLKKMCKN